MFSSVLQFLGIKRFSRLKRESINSFLWGRIREGLAREFGKDTAIFKIDTQQGATEYTWNSARCYVAA